MTLGVIWAQSRGGVIGRDGRMPWHVPEDARYFREVTTGHPVIMGRRTWESLPPRFQPLPQRRNIVISRQPSLRLAGAEVAHSLEEALRLAHPGPAWVVGGGQVYAEALAVASVVKVTEIDIDVAGDVFAPPLTGWVRRSVSDWRVSESGPRFRHLCYRRTTPPAPVMPPA